MENHDQPRSISRFEDDSPKYCAIAGKLLSVLETAVNGTLYVYEGQKLGQISFRNWPVEKYEDFEIINNYRAIKDEHGEDSEQMKKFLDAIALLS